MKKIHLTVLSCFTAGLAIVVSCLKADLPAVTTTVEEIRTTSAVLGGTVTDDGGARIDARGICWGTNHSPDKLNSTVYYRHGDTGPFTIIVSVLNPNTTYHVRAFATNYIGTAYGDEIDFTTKQLVKPEVTTILDTSTVSYSAVVAGGLIKSDDDTPVFERGISLSDRMVPGGTGPGNFTCIIRDLRPETDYGIRAYARYLNGIVYGEEKHFRTTVFPFITLPVDSITRTTAKAAGQYLFEDYPDDTFVWLYGWIEGVCYGTSPLPTRYDNFVEADSVQRDSIFACALKNLSPGTLYYVRAFRHFEAGYIHIPAYDEYANEVTFTTAR